MKRYNGAQPQGFTIIEVMIVLAIAGVILMIVFQALPALQRGSRNNQRKQDIAIILQGVSHYGLNNSGGFPTDCHDQTDPNCYLYYTSTLKYFPIGSVSIMANPGVPNPPAVSNTDPESVQIYNYRLCQEDGSATMSGAGYRDIVALFGVEGASGPGTAICQQL